VHTAWARGGLRVTSVAAQPGVPAADVIAAAYRLATAIATGGEVAQRSLFALPLEPAARSASFWARPRDGCREIAVLVSAAQGLCEVVESFGFDQVTQRGWVLWRHAGSPLERPADEDRAKTQRGRSMQV
jgi:hypothetical protein